MADIVETTTDDDCEEEIVGMFELLDAIAAAVANSHEDVRTNLAVAFDGWRRDFPEDYHWATGPQAPALLNLMLLRLENATSDPKEKDPNAATAKADGCDILQDDMGRWFAWDRKTSSAAVEGAPCRHEAARRYCEMKGLPVVMYPDGVAA